MLGGHSGTSVLFQLRSCLNQANTAQTFCFCSLVYGDVISKHFWLWICGLLVCFGEGTFHQAKPG